MILNSLLKHVHTYQIKSITNMNIKGYKVIIFHNSSSFIKQYTYSSHVISFPCWDDL